MVTQPSISVRGEAVLEVDPEIAVISVAVMVRDKDRRRAVDLLAKRNGKVLAMVRALGEAVDKVESGAASVQPEFKDGGRGKDRVTGYVARGNISVTISDFTVLGDLVTGLAGEEMVAVTGPWWSLRPDSPVRRRARVSAAQDALQRAREYADAFGATVTELVHLADPGLLADADRPQIVHARTAGRAEAFATAAAAEELEFEPVKQSVRAVVDARFLMTAPTLGG